MKTYLTIYVPELDILKTISREITSIDTSSFFNDRGKEYYKVEPYIYTSDGLIATHISKNDFNNINNDNYESQIISDFDRVNCLLEEDFDISYFCHSYLNNIAITVSYIGDCEEYIGEKIAIERMKEYAENLKEICVNKLAST